MNTARLLVIVVTLLLSPFVNAIGPEIAVSSPPLGASCGRQERTIAIAMGRVVLLVWQSSGENYSRVYVARIDARGNTLDPTGIALGEPGSFGQLIDAAGGAEGVLVVWRSEGASPGLHATYVDANGAVDADCIVEPPIGRAWDRPRLAWNGSVYLLVDHRDGTFLDARGRPIGRPLPIPETVAPFADIAIASNGRSFLLAIPGYADTSIVPSGHGLFLVEISATGEVATPRLFNDHGPDVHRHGLVWDGSHYAMVLRETIPGAYAQNLYLLDDHGNPVRAATPLPAWEGYRPSQLASAGHGLLVVHDTEGVISASRVNAAGDLVDGAPVAIADRAPYPGDVDAVWNGTDYFIGWSDERLSDGRYPSPTGPDIFGLVVPPSLRGSAIDGVSDGELLVTSARLQRNSRIAKGRNVDLVVWEELDPETNVWRVVASRLDASGIPLDAAGVVLAPVDRDQTQPVVAFDGNRFLVTWVEAVNERDRVVRSTSIDELGSAGAHAIEISSVGPVKNPQAVWIGAAFVVAWEVEAGIPAYAWRNLIYARRVSAGGIVIDRDDVLLTSDTGTGHFDPALAWNGTNLLLAFAQGTLCTHGATFCQYRSWPLDLYTMIVSPDLRPIGAPLRVSAERLNERRPSLAWSGREFLAAWTVAGQEYVGDRLLTWSSIHVAVLDENGIPRGGTGGALAGPATLDDDAAVAWSGSVFTLVWRRRPQWLAQPDILGLRFARSGAATASALNVSATGEYEGPPAIASGSSMSTVVYSRSVPELGLGPGGRVFSRAFGAGRQRPIRRE